MSADVDPQLAHTNPVAAHQFPVTSGHPARSRPRVRVRPLPCCPPADQLHTKFRSYRALVQKTPVSAHKIPVALGGKLLLHSLAPAQGYCESLADGCTQDSGRCTRTSGHIHVRRWIRWMATITAHSQFRSAHVNLRSIGEVTPLSSPIYLSAADMLRLTHMGFRLAHTNFRSGRFFIAAPASASYPTRSPADCFQRGVHIFPVCAQKIPVEFGKAAVFLERTGISGISCEFAREQCLSPVKIARICTQPL